MFNKKALTQTSTAATALLLMMESMMGTVQQLDSQIGTSYTTYALVAILVLKFLDFPTIFNKLKGAMK